MLTIRFNRVGKRNRAQFRIVVQEHTIAPGGRHIEVLGSYDPHLKKSVLKADRIKYWIEKGAQTSESAHNLFLKEGIIEGKKKPIYMKRPKKASADAEAVADKEVSEEVVAEVPVEAVVAVVEAPKEEVVVENKPAEEVKA